MVLSYLTYLSALVAIIYAAPNPPVCVRDLHDYKIHGFNPFRQLKNINRTECLTACYELVAKSLCKSINYFNGRCEIYPISISDLSQTNHNFIYERGNTYIEVRYDCASESRSFGMEPSLERSGSITWANWGSWAACSKSCNGGIQRRSRRCHFCPNGIQVAKEEIKLCNMIECVQLTAPNFNVVLKDQSMTPQWLQWEQWSSCSQPPCGGQKTRSRKCSVYTCPYGSDTDSQPCQCSNTGAGSYVSAAWNQWQSWQQCSSTCGTGQRARQRQCVSPTGVQCDASQYGATASEQCNNQPCPVWSSWQQWSSCSATCGQGNKMRHRTCNGQGCVGEATDSQSCSNEPCCNPWGQWTPCSAYCGDGQETRTRTCGYKKDTQSKSCYKQCATWSSWTPLSACSATCGSGQSSRTRTCSISGQCQGSAQDSQACEGGPCPNWVSWNKWSECSNTCGGGNRKRYRACTHGSLCSGYAAGMGEQGEACGNEPCPTWTNWESWGACSASCGQGMQQRTRSCQYGQNCDGGTQSGIASKTCNPGPCASWAEWGPYGECSQTCGNTATKKRSRQCQYGVNCNGLATETSNCPTNPCPKWSDWQNWEQCSKTCGDGGTRSRLRACSHGTLCGGQPSETSDCQVPQCPAWTQWHKWTPCSASCGQGTRSRTRTCQNPVVHGTNNGCSGLAQEAGQCQAASGPCPTWSPWQDWTGCSATCGIAQMTRQRKCLYGQSCGGGSYMAESNCNVPACPQWSQWQEWTSCSSTCGDGSHTRTRICENPSSGVNGGCAGSPTDTAACRASYGACPVWSQWGSWSNCAVTCGRGTKQRDRSCMNGLQCVGARQDSTECDLGKCPQWNDWGQWTACSQTCGQGRRNRARLCSHGTMCSPAGGGTQDETCSGQACPEWKSWESWSGCSQTCGSGYSRRQRQCTYASCDNGDKEQANTCNTGPCPAWATWGPWSDCSVTCGGAGSVVRVRSCSHNPTTLCGSKKPSETKPCGSYTPCASWNSWQSWSACDKTCDTGIKRRSRACSSVGQCLGDSSGSKSCASQPCPSYSQWTSWTTCSVTCGNGQTTRSRQCQGYGAQCDGTPQESRDCQMLPCGGYVAAGNQDFYRNRFNSGT